MIPVKLQMRNFMCYRDNVPTIYFDGIHTACISGDNGNGMSGFFDALTGGVWVATRTRGTKISDDALIHQGQGEMEVELDFAIGEQLYRIIRKHARPRSRRSSGQTILEFQIATGDGFRSIAESTIPETQKRISEAIHMDYPTFINSAFLRQGHADEFTIKRPVERKEVLASILDLSIYDELEEEAKKQVKQQETERAQLESAIQDIGDELSQKPALEAELEPATSELERISAAVGEQETELSHRRQEKELLENKRLQLSRLEQYISETERDTAQWEEQLRQRRSRIKEYEGLIAQRSTIEEGYQQLTTAKNSCEELDKKFRQLAALNQHRHQLEMAIERAQAALIAEHKLAQNKISELEAERAKLPNLKEELRKTDTGRQQLAELEETLRRKREGHQELQAQVSRLEANIARLKQEIADADEKLKMLLDQHEARCPLCETELGEEGLKLIEAKYAADRDSKAASLKSDQAELSQKTTGARSLEHDLSQIEQRLNQDRAAIQSRADILKSDIAEAEAAASHLDEERTRLAEIEQSLARKDFAGAEQRALAELDTEVEKLGYNQGQHDEMRQRLKGLQQYESARQRLEEADRLLNQEREAASSAETAIQDRRHRLEVNNQNRQELATELNLLPQVAEALTRAETEYKTLSDRQRKAQETLWGLKAKLERLIGLEEKRRGKKKSLEQALAEEGIYRELAQAFGKRGIQAMLIESALPEIEAEANKLLSRMTDNRMQVKIETQRETKKGDLLETLDINISDELGMRSYEMFSGGEAFRINFAIRIALSRLLARRAGAPLRTLIIDEGFGTQDSHGIEKIKEAINSIQDDFDKILVITHIDELQDAFPTRIKVIKTGEGSTVEVS